MILLSRLAWLGSLLATAVAFLAAQQADAAAAKMEWTESLLYSFNDTQSHPDGTRPIGVLAADSQGNLYGATNTGSSYNTQTSCNCGAVFKVTPQGVETVLHFFNGSAGNDGSFPASGVIVDKQGNVYGTTPTGGNSACNNGCGVVYKIAADGTETVLHVFAGGSDGSNPMAPPITDSKGNLYGTTSSGGNTSCSGNEGCGTVYKIAANGTESVLYVFPSGGSDGLYPEFSLIMKSGILYGTTAQGGTLNPSFGTIFSVTRGGAETVVWNFCNATGCEGAYPTPQQGVVMDKSGNLYGAVGGGTGYGIVYKLSGNVETVLYTFCSQTNCTDGWYPNTPAFVRKYLYGTTQYGGSTDNGTIFEINSGGAYSVLYSFAGGSNDGCYPSASPLHLRSGFFGALGSCSTGDEGAIYRVGK